MKRLLLLLNSLFIFIQCWSEKGIDFNGGFIENGGTSVPKISYTKSGNEYKIYISKGVYKTYIPWNTSNTKRDADAEGIATEKLIIKYSDGTQFSEIIRVAYKNNGYNKPTKFNYETTIDLLESTGTSTVDNLNPKGKNVEFEWTFNEFSKTFSSNDLNGKTIESVSVSVWCSVIARSRDNAVSHKAEYYPTQPTSANLTDCGGFDGKPLYAYLIDDTYVTMATSGGIQWITTEENITNQKLAVEYNNSTSFTNTEDNRLRYRNKVVNGYILDSYNYFTYKWNSPQCSNKTKSVYYYVISQPTFPNLTQRYNNTKECKSLKINGDTLVIKKPLGINLDPSILKVSYTWEYFDDRIKKWINIANLFSSLDVIDQFTFDKTLDIDLSKADLNLNKIKLRQSAYINAFNITIRSNSFTINLFDNISESDLAWRNDANYEVCENETLSDINDLIIITDTSHNLKNKIELSYFAATPDNSKRTPLTDKVKFGAYTQIVAEANSGCNTIIKKKALSVSDLSTFDQKRIGQIDIDSYVDPDHKVQDRTSNFSISEKTNSTYYGFSDDYNLTFSININKGKNFTIYNLEMGDYMVNDTIYRNVDKIDFVANKNSNIYIHKLNSLDCQSKSTILIKVNVYGDIIGNKPYKDTIYHCPNTTITVEEIDKLYEPSSYSDDENIQPEYKYRFRKLGDFEWFDFNNNLIAFEDSSIQIQRVVYFNTAHDETSTSNIINFKPIKKNFNIGLATSTNSEPKESKLDLCFNEPLYAKILDSNVDTTKTNYWRINDGDLIVLQNPINGFSKLTNGIGTGSKKISLAVCGGTVFSRPVDVFAPDSIFLDIRGELDINTNCLRAGDSLKIKHNHTSNEVDYFFVQNEESSSCIVLEETMKYLTVRKTQHGCAVKDTVKIKVDKKINPTKLRIGNEVYEAGATINVCADKALEITSENPSDRLLYSFLDVTTNNDENFGSASNLTHELKFENKGKTYTILRQAQTNKQCFGKIDTFFFKTYNDLDFTLTATSKAGKPNVSAMSNRNVFKSYCKGDGDTITFRSNPNSTGGGSGEYIYRVLSEENPDLIVFSGDYVDSFSIGFSEVTNERYYVRIYDKNCPSYISTYSYTYKDKTKEATGLSFTNIIDINDFTNLKYTDGSGNTDIRDLKKLKGETNWELTINDNIVEEWKYVVTDVKMDSVPKTPECPNARPESETTITINPGKTDASLTLYRWAFLDDCKTQCSASFDIPFHCSNGWGNIDKFEVALSTDGDEKQTKYVGCSKSKVKVTIEIEDLPKIKGGLYYDIYSFSEIEDKISYQWQQKIGNSYWLNIEGETGSSAEIEINSNEVKYVRCIATYNGDKLTSYNTITIYSEQTINSAPLYGINNTTSTKVCAGNSVKELYLELSKAYPITTTNNKTNIEYVWEFSTDKKNWVELNDDKTQEFYISEANSYKTYFSAKKLDEETYIRCGIKFNGCQTSIYSYLYTIKIDDAINLYPLHDKNGNSYVRLISNPIISGISGSNDFLEFLINYQIDKEKCTYTFGAVTDERYKFIKKDSINKVSISQSDWDEDYFTAGLHYATIQKEHIEGCKSSVDTFTYELFEQMSIKNMNDSIFEYNLCKNDTIKNIMLIGYGGDYKVGAKPQIQWYVKSGTYEGSIENANIYLHYDSITITQKKTFTGNIWGLVAYQDLILYATIHSGNYPIDITSPVITINVKPEVKASPIYNETESICYNTLPSLYEKDKSTGGSGNYSYAWQRSFDDGKTWEDLTTDGSESYIGVATESLKSNAKYKRTVSERCVSSFTYNKKNNKYDYIASYSHPEEYYSDTSVAKVIVKDSFLTDANKVLLNTNNKTIVVPTNQEIVFKYNTKAITETQYSYFVILNKKNEIIDTLVQKESMQDPFTTKIEAKDKAIFNEGNYYYTLTKYNKKDQCPSLSDTFIVTVINGGRIKSDYLTSIGNNRYWMCLSDSVGEIKNINSSDKITSYRWTMYDKDNHGFTILNKDSNRQETAESINIDNTNVAMIIKEDNGDGSERIFKFVRDGFYDELSDPVASDTLYLHVAGNIRNLKLTNTISPKYAEICSDVNRVNIEVTLDSTAISDKKFGTLKYFSNNGAGYSNGKTFKTYWEQTYGNGQDGIKDDLWIKINDSENPRSRFYKTQTLEISDITNDEMSYRFVMDDGCTKNYTYASITVLKDSVGSFIFEKYNESLDKFIATDYIEIGDSVRIIYQHSVGSSPEINWYDSEECDSCRRFSDNSLDYRNHFTIGNIKENEQLYMSINIQGEIEGKMCETKRFRVPLIVYPSCYGGQIVANNEKICKDGEFSIINSYKPATGGDENFVYSWQYSIDLENNSWSTIENANSIYLEAGLLNSIAKGNTTLYIRRKATNRGESSVFSNTVLLERYDAFVPGTLSFNDSVKRSAICYDDIDSLPSIISTSPTGGKGEETGYTYMWAIAVNSLSFDTLANETSNTLALTKYLNEYNIDSLNENTVQIKCIYNDIYNMCNSVESETISLIIHSQVQTPSIHQGGSICDSDLTIVCVDDSINYNYKWNQYHDGGVFTGEVNNCIKLFRQGYDVIDVIEYGVIGIHKKTGCKTKEFKFNPNTIPVLRQQNIVEIDTICYGSDYIINLPSATGGIGEKRYQWLESDNDENYSEIAGGNTPSLMLHSLVKKTYYKRIVSDACNEIITDAIMVNVTDSIVPLSVDISNYQCRDSEIKVAIDNSTTNGNILRVYNVTMLGSLDNNLNNHEIELDKNNNIGILAGFNTDVNTYAYTTFDNKLKCHSPIVQKKLVNKPHVKVSYANISAESYSPCNETQFTITGEDAVETSINGYLLNPDKEDVSFSYKWYKSKDGHNFSLVPNENQKDLTLEIIDTLYVTRVVDNTCGETANSDTLKFIGRKLSEFTPQMEIVTSYVNNPEGEVTIKSNSFTDCILSGDGGVDTINLSSIKYGMTLPYSAKKYQNSMLYVLHTRGECIRPFRIKPLVGNLIDTDCRDKSITASNIEGLDDKANLISSVWSMQQENLGEWYEINENNGYKVDELGNLMISEEDKGRSFRKEVSYQTSDKLIYSIKSNILYTTLSSPILSKITTDPSSNYVKKISPNYIQKFNSQNVIIVDTIVGNYTDVHLEIEYEDKHKDIINPYVYNGIVNFNVLNNENANYRVVATNNCGTTTSDYFFVKNIEEKLIDDADIEIKHAKCKGDSAFIRCYDNSTHGTGKYEYSYELTPHKGASYGKINKINNYSKDGAYTVDNKHYNGEKTQNAICITNVNGEFEVLITRFDTITGINAYKKVNLYQDSVISDFSLSLDNRNIIYSYSELEEIEINEGERISLINSSINATKYLWNIHWHDNTFIGNEEGQYDIKTDNESPSMYIYSEGYYDISLVASKENCKDTLRFNNALFISQNNSIKHSPKPIVLSINDEVTYETEDVNSINVSPTFVYDFVTIESTDKLDHKAMIVDELGRILHNVSFNGSIQISMTDYLHGIYIIIVDDQKQFKVLKVNK